MNVPRTKIFYNEDFKLVFCFVLFLEESTRNYIQRFKATVNSHFILVCFIYIFLGYLKNSLSDLIIFMNGYIVRESSRTDGMDGLIICIL